MALPTTTLATGCNGCQTDCSQFDGRVVEAELIDRREAELTLRLRDGGELLVSVSGRAEVLDEGESYLFPLFEDGTNPPGVVMAQPCACGGYVKHLDGSTVDTGLLQSLPSVGRVAAMILLGFLAVFVTWAAARRRRGATS